MADRLELVIPQIVAVLRQVAPPPGQSALAVYEAPPDTIGKLPAAVILPESFEASWQPNVRQVSESLTLQVMLSRPDAAAAARGSLPWRFAIVSAFDSHKSLGGTVLVCGISAGRWGVLTWGDAGYLGWQFTLTLDYLTPTTFVL